MASKQDMSDCIIDQILRLIMRGQGLIERQLYTGTIMHVKRCTVAAKQLFTVHDDFWLVLRDQ